MTLKGLLGRLRLATMRTPPVPEEMSKFFQPTPGPSPLDPPFDPERSIERVMQGRRYGLMNRAETRKETLELSEQGYRAEILGLYQRSKRDLEYARKRLQLVEENLDAMFERTFERGS